MKSITGNNRIAALDQYRYLSVTLAIFSHVLLNHHYADFLDEKIFLSVRSITRTATPCLIVLFGIMLEIVYYRKYKEKGTKIFNRLIYRSFLCYLALMGLAIIFTVFNQESLGVLLHKALLLKETLYGTIFALYTFLLLITIPVLWIRKKFGLFINILLILAIWIIDYFLISNSISLPRPFSLLGGLVFGLGGEFGPSFFHSLSLALAGMIVGNYLYSQKPQRFIGFTFFTLSIFCISFSLYEIFRVGIETFMQNVEDISVYRKNNSLIYYSYGFCASLVMISIAYGFSKILPTILTRYTGKVGGNTLSYFFLSNVILIITHNTTLPSPFFSVFIILIYLTFFGYITIWWANHGQNNALVLSVEHKINRFIDYLIPNKPATQVVPISVKTEPKKIVEIKKRNREGLNFKKPKELKTRI